jgi:hypothetical protein
MNEIDKVFRQNVRLLTRIAELEAELHIAEVWRVRAEQAEAELAKLNRFIEFCLDKGMVPTRQAGVIFARAEGRSLL